MTAWPEEPVAAALAFEHFAAQTRDDEHDEIHLSFTDPDGSPVVVVCTRADAYTRGDGTAVHHLEVVDGDPPLIAVSPAIPWGSTLSPDPALFTIADPPQEQQ